MTDRKKAEAGRKGGKATGPQKSWILKLTPEERSQKMREVRLKGYAKQGKTNGQPEGI